LEEFRLRIAGIIRGKTQEIPSPRRTHPLLVRRKENATRPAGKQNVADAVGQVVERHPAKFAFARTMP
jgi:hypothetical protein